MWESESDQVLNEQDDVDDEDENLEIDGEDNEDGDPSIDDGMESDEDEDDMPEHERVNHMMDILEFDEQAAHQHMHHRGRPFNFERPVDGVLNDGVELRWTDGEHQGGAFQILGRPINPARNTGVDDFIHPLLVSDRHPSSAVPSQTPSAQTRNRPHGGDLLRMTDAENTIQLLEQMFSRGPHMGGRVPENVIIAVDHRNNPRGAAILPMPNDTMPTAGAFLQQIREISGHAQIPVITDQSNEGETAPVNEKMKNLLSDTLSFTDERWKLESRLIYGASANEKALKTLNDILNILLPPAQEEFRLKKEEEDRLKVIENDVKEERKRAEAEKLRLEIEEKEKELEEKKRLVEEARLAEPIPASIEELEPLAIIEGSSIIPATPMEEDRVTIMINGAEVDITGLILI